MLIYLKKFRKQTKHLGGEQPDAPARLRRRRLLAWLPALALLSIGSFGNAYSAPKTVLVLGDSLSAEYGLSRGTGWVSLLEQRLQAQKIDARVINASISGDTTSGGRSRLPSLLGKHHPDIVVIELGGNDGLRGLPVASAEANFRAMGAAVQQSGAQLLLVGMRIPPNYGRDYADKFFGMYGVLAKDLNAPLVPFMLDGIAEKPQLFQADRIHPLAEAHPVILNTIWPHLLPLLKGKPR